MTSSQAIELAANYQIPDKQILAALGFITTLLFISGMQLYRSVNRNFKQVERVEPSLTFNVENVNKTSSSVELDVFAARQQAEMLTIKNTISHGKF